jgi:NAD(P)-dependent dehydrogenase (short-subunit alcohol dehydrogenase family)
MDEALKDPIPAGLLDLGLSAKTAVVAGAGDGIGRACAHGLAAAGASVLCADLEESRAQAVVEEIAGRGGQAHAFAGNLVKRENVAGLLEAAVSWRGDVDVVVDIIGRAVWSDVLTLADDIWDQNFAMNLRHSFYVTQILGQHMAASGRGGALVHVASIAGLTGQAGNAGYAAAKAALISLIRSSAGELGPRGIRINGVAPGTVETPRLRAVFSSDQLKALGETLPLKRQATVWEIAKAAVFLASDLAAYITGETLVVDGGAMTMFPISADMFLPFSKLRS